MGGAHGAKRAIASIAPTQNSKFLDPQLADADWESGTGLNFGSFNETIIWDHYAAISIVLYVLTRQDAGNLSNMGRKAMSPDILDFFRKTLHWDPAYRIYQQECFDHPWLFERGGKVLEDSEK